MLVACQSTYGQFYQYDKFILTESDKQLHFAAGAIATTVGYEWALKKYKGDKKKAFFVGIGEDFHTTLMKEMYSLHLWVVLLYPFHYQYLENQK